MKLCRELYCSKNQLSVGKSLELFKSQLHFKQCIKTERVCFGIKLYKLTSSNGITLNVLVIYRKWFFLNGNENRYRYMPTPERSLIHLLRPLHKPKISNLPSQ